MADKKNPAKCTEPVLYRSTAAGTKYCKIYNLSARQLWVQEIIRVVRNKKSSSEQNIAAFFRKSAAEIRKTNSEDSDWYDMRERVARDHSYIANNCRELLNEAIDQGLLER